MDPQPQADIVNQLKALSDPVDISTGNRYTFEHLDFTFKGPFADRTLRAAFAKRGPRQQIVNDLIKPQNATATVMESQFIFPFQTEYAAVAELAERLRLQVPLLRGQARLRRGAPAAAGSGRWTPGGVPSAGGST
ncbi:MAG TPA: hypothetical protein VI248_10610 [Kineosporiaceae bacterium]